MSNLPFSIATLNALAAANINLTNNNNNQSEDVHGRTFNDSISGLLAPNMSTNGFSLGHSATSTGLDFTPAQLFAVLSNKRKAEDLVERNAKHLRTLAYGNDNIANLLASSQGQQQQQHQQQQRNPFAADLNWGRNPELPRNDDLLNFLTAQKAPELKNNVNNSYSTASLLLNHQGGLEDVKAQYLREQNARDSLLLNPFRGSSTLDLLLGKKPAVSSLYGPKLSEKPNIAPTVTGINDMSSLMKLNNVLNNQLPQPSHNDFLASLMQAEKVKNTAADLKKQQDINLLLQHYGSNALTCLSAQPPQQPAIASLVAEREKASIADKSTPRLSLPSCDEGRIQPYTDRGKYSLGIDEDSNWLSEFHCFVRTELIEVFRASHEDCKARNNSISYQQVGIRCRFCAHMASTSRVGRAAAFPSSLRQIYQSFTMMLRDHFGNCDAMPSAIRDKFLALKDKPSQGATDSKRYWIYSAMKIGMADSSEGIQINETTVSSGAKASPFGTLPGQVWTDDNLRNIPLVLPTDSALVPEFLMLLMAQVQVVHLTDSERIGNRRSLRVGLPGFGCRHCCEHRRLGLCRMFPARRRTLPSKITDLYDHLRRCTVTPQAVKDQMQTLHRQLPIEIGSDKDEEKEFFDRIWSRLGHGSSLS